MAVVKHVTEVFLVRSEEVEDWQDAAEVRDKGLANVGVLEQHLLQNLEDRADDVCEGGRHVEWVGLLSEDFTSCCVSSRIRHEVGNAFIIASSVYIKNVVNRHSHLVP